MNLLVRLLLVCFSTIGIESTCNITIETTTNGGTLFVCHNNDSKVDWAFVCHSPTPHHPIVCVMQFVRLNMSTSVDIATVQNSQRLIVAAFTLLLMVSVLFASRCRGKEPSGLQHVV
jgi:hypothetical protein